MRNSTVFITLSKLVGLLVTLAIIRPPSIRAMIDKAVCSGAASSLNSPACYTGLDEINNIFLPGYNAFDALSFRRLLVSSASIAVFKIGQHPSGKEAWVKLWYNWA